MRKILVIGIGMGNPAHLTLEAIEALNAADVFFIPDKGAEKADLRLMREDICTRAIRTPAYRTVGFDMPKRAPAGDAYLDVVDDWHARIGALYADLFTTHVPDDACGAFLVWGDPALYDSTIRILQRMQGSGFAMEMQVIPGISAVQVLCARHAIPLNRIGEPVLITTGRRLAEEGAGGHDTIVVMLDGDMAFRHLAAEDPEIYWGAYLGTEKEILISGRLSAVSDEIAHVRAAARAAHGWIMDTYLLRRG
ncbi:precorrin-6A synthase (deacetylating) [Xanthobacteraceae bacterium A53D]